MIPLGSSSDDATMAIEDGKGWEDGGFDEEGGRVSG